MGETTATPVPNGVRLTARQTATFLDTLSATGNVNAAARSAGLSVVSFYRRRRCDPAFAEAWQAAKAIAYERIEAAALAQAVARIAAAGASSSPA
jgi:hypothetical protein